MSGTVVFNETRVPVTALFDYLDSEGALAEFLHDFPTVSREQAGKRCAWHDRRLAGIRMKILLNEHIPNALARSFADEWDIRCTQRMGWQGKENCDLLLLAGGCGLDALNTADRTMPHEQNANTPLPVVVLRTFSLQALMPQAIALLKKRTFRTFHVIGASSRQERARQRQQERGWEWGR